MNIPADWWNRPHRPGDREAVKAQARAAAEHAARVARATARQPGDPLPAFLYHHAWDPETGREHRCDHRVVGATAGFVYLEQPCFHPRARVEDAAKRARLPRTDVEQGLPTVATVLRTVKVNRGTSAECFRNTRDRVEMLHPRAGEAPQAREPRRTKRAEGPRVAVFNPNELLCTEALAALGLRSMPTAPELRAAWHAAARRHHPDAGGRAEDFTKARAAYERLQRAVA